MPEPRDSLDKAIEVMARLRAPDGCPWDREQDHATLKPFLIEEAYEVLEAIDRGEPGALREELGDLLLQVIFHCQLAREAGRFDIFDVAEGLAEKIIARHPHVFGEGRADTSAEVLRNWEIDKRNGREARGEESRPASILDGVPADLPALLRSQRLQGKAARVGFDWPAAEGAAGKVEEEWAEVKEAMRAGVTTARSAGALEHEVGDLLFAVVNLSRKLGVNAEEAARSAVGRFLSRFHRIEEALRARGLSPEKVSLEELDRLWREAKAEEDDRRRRGKGPAPP
ncbi:MAG: nucleoside triphosphate pyrophosphohydrolase [bacterium]